MFTMSFDELKMFLEINGASRVSEAKELAEKSKNARKELAHIENLLRGTD